MNIYKPTVILAVMTLCIVTLTGCTQTVEEYDLSGFRKYNESESSEEEKNVTKEENDDKKEEGASLEAGENVIIDESAPDIGSIAPTEAPEKEASDVKGNASIASNNNEKTTLEINNLHWGMSKADVIKIKGYPTTSEDTFLYYQSNTFAGVDTASIYLFDNEKLVTISHSTVSRSLGSSTSNYLKMLNELTDRYSTPLLTDEVSTYEALRNADMEYVKDILPIGDRTQYSLWQTTDTMIMVVDYEYEGIFAVGVTFADVSFVKAQNMTDTLKDVVDDYMN